MKRNRIQAARWIGGIALGWCLWWGWSHGAQVSATTERYQQAVADYNFQLDQYRSSYNDFRLKREQFNNIDSFANQEALVAASKSMLTLRAKVWQTYWQALWTDVTDTEGMDGTIRSKLTEEIEGYRRELATHEATLSASVARDELLEAGEWLNDQDKNYQNTLYKTALEIRIARFHWALLQLEAFVPILRNNVEIQIRDTSVKNQKLRGLDEVEQLLTSSREQYSKIIEAYYKREEIRDYKNSSEEIVKNLSGAFEPLRRAQQLVSEIAKGTIL